MDETPTPKTSPPVISKGPSPGQPPPEALGIPSFETMDRFGRAVTARLTRLLLWTTLVVAVAPLAIPFLGPLSAMFGFVPVSTLQIGAVIAIVIGYIAATEGAKIWFYARGSKRSRRLRH